jgi:hypothetical protein
MRSAYVSIWLLFATENQHDLILQVPETRKLQVPDTRELQVFPALTSPCGCFLRPPPSRQVLGLLALLLQNYKY